MRRACPTGILTLLLERAVPEIQSRLSVKKASDWLGAEFSMGPGPPTATQQVCKTKNKNNIKF